MLGQNLHSSFLAGVGTVRHVVKVCLPVLVACLIIKTLWSLLFEELEVLSLAVPDLEHE
jgi:hypothetical protein